MRSLANFLQNSKDDDAVSAFKDFIHSTLALDRVKEKLLEYGIEFRYLRSADPNLVSIRICFDIDNKSLFERNVNAFISDLHSSEKNYL